MITDGVSKVEIYKIVLVGLVAGLSAGILYFAVFRENGCNWYEIAKRTQEKEQGK
jgi:hypothetical protein